LDFLQQIEKLIDFLQWNNSFRDHCQDLKKLLKFFFPVKPRIHQMPKSLAIGDGCGTVRLQMPFEDRSKHNFGLTIFIALISHGPFE
jgi:hypothetical protein